MAMISVIGDVRQRGVTTRLYILAAGALFANRKVLFLTIGPPEIAKENERILTIQMKMFTWLHQNIKYINSENLNITEIMQLCKKEEITALIIDYNKQDEPPLLKLARETNPELEVTIGNSFDNLRWIY